MNWATCCGKARAFGVAVLVSLVYLGCAAATDSGAVEITTEHRAEIERLMDIINVDQMGKLVGEQMGQQMVQLMDSKSPESFTRAMEIIFEVFDEENVFEDVLNDLIPIYAKYFTLEEVREMIAWYETPLGKKSIEVMPQLIADSMQVSQQRLGAILPELEEKITARLKSEGLINEPEEAPFKIISRPGS